MGQTCGGCLANDKGLDEHDTMRPSVRQYYSDNGALLTLVKVQAMVRGYQTRMRFRQLLEDPDNMAEIFPAIHAARQVLVPYESE